MDKDSSARRIFLPGVFSAGHIIDFVFGQYYNVRKHIGTEQESENIVMEINIPERARREMIQFAEKNNIQKIVLFGSRARGTNTERSDIDIAVYGGDFDGFYWDVKEKIHSLLSFDIIEVDSGISEELLKEIRESGVDVYEKA